MQAGGQPAASPITLGIEDQLLMMLEYWREYRTYFHIGQAESAAFRNIKWCENTLAKSTAFHLPGRAAVEASERAFAVVLIDATESPIERPKKGNGATTQVRRSGTL